MFGKMGKLFVAVSCIGLLASSPALAVSIIEIADWNTIKGANNSNSQFAGIADGDTSYHSLTGNSSPAITKVSNLGGALSHTTLVTSAQWAAVGGGTSLNTFHGFSAYGSYLQFGDTSTDAIWRVDKNSGAITKYVSRAAIDVAAGTTNANVLGNADTAPDGEFVFRESNTGHLMKTTGPDSAIQLVTKTQLESLQGVGNAAVSGGLTFDAAGTLYWGNNNNKAIYYRTSDGTLGTLAAGLGMAGAFNDMLFAPDGWLYMHDNTSKDIRRLHPSDPAGTFQVYISAADLVAGIGSSGVYQLSWYQNTLAWNIFQTNGLYIPEPATLVMLLAGAAGLVRRRIRR